MQEFACLPLRSCPNAQQVPPSTAIAARRFWQVTCRTEPSGYDDMGATIDAFEHRQEEAEHQGMRVERRSAPRENVDSLVYLDLQPGNGGILLNLNANGMRVSLAHPLKLSKPVSFSFGLDSPANVKGVGRVAWITESGKSAGIRFEDLSNDSLAVISKWLNSSRSTAVDEPNENVDEPRLPGDIQFAAEELKTEARDEIPPGVLEMSSALTDEWPSGHGRPEDNSGTPAPAEPTAARLDFSAKDSSPSPEPDHVKGDAEASSASYPQCFLPPTRNESVESTPNPIAEECQSVFDAAEPIACLTPQQTSSSAVPLNQAGMESVLGPAPAECGSAPVHPGLNDPLPVWVPSTNSQPSVASTPVLASRLIFAALTELGAALERDWHVTLGMLLIILGFAVPWHKLPLVTLAIAFWIAGSLILSNMKSSTGDLERQDSERLG